MSGTKSRPKERARDVTVASGTQTHLSQWASVFLGGQTMTPAQIAQRIQDHIALLDAVTAAHVSLAAAVAALKAEERAYSAFMTAFEHLLRGMYGEDAKTLSDFAMAPRKEAKIDTLAKADAVLKMRATRRARGTMGKKQKAKIKGTVPADATVEAAASRAAAALAAPLEDPGVVALASPVVHGGAARTAAAVPVSAVMAVANGSGTPPDGSRATHAVVRSGVATGS